MKQIAIAVLLMMAGAGMANDESVRGYIRRDGTYVQPHHQTTPNSTKLDNYSTQGNVNPYTGREGTVNPYSTPQPTYTPPANQSGYGTSPRQRYPY